MAHILIMPRQGNTVESCIITNWKVKEGDAVTAETVVCEVETDKASFEVPAGAAGTVVKLLHDRGDDVPVLQPIAVIGEAGEDWQEALSGGSSRQDAGAITQEISHEDTMRNSEKSSHKDTGAITKEISHEDTKAQRSGTEEIQDFSSSLGVFVPSCDNNSERSSAPSCDELLRISPRARRLGVTVTGPGTGPGGRIIERDVEAALQNQPPLTAAAKAASHGSLPAAGSGLGGRVTLEDLSSTLNSQLSTFNSQLPAEGAITETPIKGIRKIIADRMFASLAESAQLTLNASAPAAKLLEFRSGIKAQAAIAEELGLAKITINDLILFAVSRIIPRFPYMNAHKTGDTIKTFERLHLAVAVDTPRGLMVPVIRNANLLSLAQISSESKRLAAACQNGTAMPDELSGSTFTVTNLGSFGITSFTPVLNAPEVAILGVCSIEMKGAVPHIGFSLTINHQAVDGAPAARFLKALSEAVEHIDLFLAAQ